MKRPKRPLDGLDDDIRDHIARETQDNIDQGMSLDEARRRAMLKFGNVALIKEDTRAVWFPIRLDQLLQDTRFALRLIRRSPGFAAVTVATLALGIGANTAIFSLVNTLLLKRLPVTEPSQLALVVTGQSGAWSNPVWEQIRQRRDMFDGALAWSTNDARFNVTRGEQSQWVNGLWASGDFFATLGVPAIVGRTFVEKDDQRGGGPDGPVAVISHGFWQRYFGGEAGAVGRRLTIERIPFTIIGITPAGFLGPEVGSSYDVAIPIGLEPVILGERESRLDRRSSSWLNVVVRLKAGQSRDRATLALRNLQSEIRNATRPVNLSTDQRDRYLVEPFTLVAAGTGVSRFLRPQYTQPLLIVMAVVVLVLLTACANIANLFLARATARRREWGVRLALGGSYWRLARLLLTESLILSVIGATAGLVIARWGSQFLVRHLSTQEIPIQLDLTLDWRVLAVTGVMAVGTALLCGIAPAFRASMGGPVDALKEQAGATSTGGSVRIAGAFVVAQIALSVVLVVAAGLFLRTLESLVTVPLGFVTDRVMLVDIDARRTTIPPHARLAMYEQVRKRVLAIPGVASAAVASNTPASGTAWAALADVSTAPIRGQERLVYFNAITPGWLSTFDTKLVAGRDIVEGDVLTAERIALVNETFARTFLKDASPIGHRVQAIAGAPRVIVGIVEDAIYRDLREPIPPTVYVPFAQYDGSSIASVPPGRMNLSVRAHAGSAAVQQSAVSAAVGAVDPNLVLTFQSLTDRVKDTLGRERLLAMVSGFFGALALLLAAIGIYGVTSYAVNQRRTEIAIRMALGATRAVVVRLALRRVLTLVGVGIFVGLLVSIGATQYVATFLYRIEPRDPVTLASCAVVLAIVGALAGWLPAYRASQCRLSEALRDS